jgi:hypothetical protein
LISIQRLRLKSVSFEVRPKFEKYMINKDNEKLSFDNKKRYLSEFEAKKNKKYPKRKIKFLVKLCIRFE